jgi:3-oxoacyl-[acyl-carrier-protein] synthase II
MSTASTDHVAVVATGIGIITPLGDTLDSFMQALCAGHSSVATLAGAAPVAGSALRDFEATRYANVRGMRVYNRATRLGICATRLALQDAGLENSGFPGERLGVVTAGTFAHFDTLIEYDRSLMTQGPSRTNPALMPLAIPSAPGAVIALSFGAKACSITLADGGAGGLDAIGLAARLVRAGRVGACVVVSALAFFDELLLSAARAGLIVAPDAFHVFDRRSRGSAFGEAGVALVLESADAAHERGAKPKGSVLGQASTFGGSELQHGLVRAARRALAVSNTNAAGIGLCSSGANGTRAVDVAEASALLTVLGPAAEQTPVTAIKASMGDAFDASGLLQTVVAMAALAGNPAPPIAGFAEPVVGGLGYLTAPARVSVSRSLVTATSLSGACSALVVGGAGQ